MIKVCHVTSMHNPFDTRIFVKECGSLRKKYDVSLVASNIKTQEKDGIHIIGVPISRKGILKKLTTGPTIEAAESVDADIYHIHDPELMKAGLKLKKKGKKIIFDYHENYAEFLLTKDWIPRPFRQMASQWFLRQEARVLPKYDCLVSVTPYIVERLRRYNPNTYQITNYPLLKEHADERNWGSSVAFVGGVVPEWMLSEVVNALPRTNARVKLAGSVHPKKYLEGMMKLPGWSQVDYAGKIPYSEVFPFLKSSSAGLAIRTYDDPNVCYRLGSLGVNKFFEYMMAGIPIIASDLKVWRDIIEKYRCGIIVNPYDEHSIADAINYCINNKEEARKMGDNGYKAVREFFHWGTQEKILFDMYDSLISH